MKIEDKIQAAIELLNVRVDAVPLEAAREIAESISKLKKAVRIIVIDASNPNTVALSGGVG